MSGAAQERVMDKQLDMLNLHSHPALMAHLFATRFQKAHNPPSWFRPRSLRVGLDALIKGEGGAC
jgi:hypothetical protein